MVAARLTTETDSQNNERGIANNHLLQWRPLNQCDPHVSRG